MPDRIPLTTIPLLPLLLVVAARTDAQASDARALFLKNCASCHGENGDGKGTTELDRPARSFKDGGFSFGNTPEALFRTISVGIPGSPMAGFDSSLSEDERKLLAAYVVTLGPPIEEVRIEDTIMTVHDRPVVVRGLLPSMGEGLPQHPRGLLVGDPSGVTFEYQVDDVRLLGLRQGGFVRRTDWTGRGGTALEPLGKVVLLVAGGKPEALFRTGGQPLTARLSGTCVEDVATLDYHLVRDGRELAHVDETPAVVSTPLGTGYERRFHYRALASPIQLRTPAFPGARVVANGTWNGSDHERWFVLRPAEGPPVYLGLSPGQDAGLALESTAQIDQTILPPAQGKSAESKLTVLVLTGYDDQVQASLRRWKEGR